MLSSRESLRKELLLGELNDPSLSKHSQILYEEEYHPKSMMNWHGKRHKRGEKSSIKNDSGNILKVSSEKKLAHAAFLQRVIRGKIALIVDFSSLIH